MAPENGKPASLSALQAALRKPAVAKTAPPKAGQPQAQGTKRPLPASQAAVGTPPVKKVIVKSVQGTPAPKLATLSKAPGVIAKTPATATLASGALAKRGVAKAPAVGTSAKSGSVPAGAMAKTPGIIAKAPAAGAAPATAAKTPGSVMGTTGKATPVRPAAPDNGLTMASVGDIVATIEAAPGNAKIRSVVRLADALGSNLQIEHINHFLRALKKKVIERAQADGVRVPSASLKPPAPAAATAAAAAPAAGALAAAAAAQAARAAATPGPRPPAPGAAAPKPGVAKAPVAKAPVAKVSASPKAPVAKVAAAAPRPAQPKAESKPPPSSPSPSSSGGDDQLYTIIGELGEDPVVTDGELNDARLGDVLRRLWDGAARKPKDWVMAWQTMSIPVEKQGEALQKFLNMAFSEAGMERASMVIADLVKAHRLKMRSVEDVLVTFGHNLDGILALNEDAWHIYAQFLVQVFPKPATAGWGWSRVGWSWASWFKFAEQCIQSLDGARASDALCMVLRLIQERETAPIGEVQGWAEGDKLSKFVAKIAELSACEPIEAAEKLGQQGVVVQV